MNERHYGFLLGILAAIVAIELVKWCVTHLRYVP